MDQKKSNINVSPWLVEVLNKRDDDKAKLAVEDDEYGLKEEQIRLYLSDEYTVKQARILSECMREKALNDILDIIQKETYSRMDQVLRFYKLGLSKEIIQQALKDTKTAAQLNQVLTSISIEEEKRLREEAISTLERIAASREKTLEEVQEKKEEAETKRAELKTSKETSTPFNGAEQIKEERDYMYNGGTVLGGLIPIEMAPIHADSLVTSYIGNLFGKRKTGAAIIKKLVKYNYTVEQLEEIRKGVAKGLDMKILDKISNPKLSPEIIASLIAVAEDAERWNG